MKTSGSTAIPVSSTLRAPSKAQWYFLSVIFTVAALAVTWFVPTLRQTALLLIPVVISALYGGLGPGLTSSALVIAAANLIFSNSSHLLPTTAVELLRISNIAVFSILVSTLGYRRRQAEEALRRREQFFRLLIENTSDLMTIISADGSIMYVSPSVERVLGYAPGEIQGKKVFNFCHPEDMPIVNEFFHTRLSVPGISPGLELRVLAKNGEWRVLESIANNLLHEPGVGGILMHSRDITTRRELAREQVARRGAEAARKRFHELVEGLDAIVWEAEADGRFTFVSHRLRSLLGYSPEAWVKADWVEEGDGWLAHVFPDDRAAVLAAMAPGPESRRDVEYRALSAAGDMMWLRMTVHQSASDGLRRLRGLIMDVTERHAAESALRESERLAATGRLAASIAHEINNPLAAVTNLAFLLEHSPSLDPSAREYARMAQEELRRMAHITRQMLSFYRDSGTPVVTDAAELMNNVLELYDGRLAKQGIHIERAFEAAPRIEASPGELQQVFSNLVLNAADATQGPGRIRVHIYGSREWKHGHSGVRIVVADTGCGMGPQDRQRIFEPFFTTKGQKGTGLGLWITHGIVQKHGGSIQVRSSSDAGRSGTCLSIFLPQVRSASSELASMAASGSAA